MPEKNRPFQNTLITGASAGLGKALAHEFASRGHSLVLLARREDLLAELKQELERKFRVKVYIRAVDVNDEQGMRQTVRESRALLGPIDTVIANAGFGVSGDVEKLTLKDFERQFDVNVFGVVKTVLATLTDIQETQGRICLIGSTSAYLTIPGSTAYSMSKYAVRSLAEGLYAELAPTGASVTLINPGFINTEIRKVSNDGVLHGDSKDPAPTWLMMPADQAARKIYRAIRRRKRERALTVHSQLGIWAARFFPGLVAFALRRR